MRIVSSGEIDACLEDRHAIEALRRAYRSDTIVPEIAKFNIERFGDKRGSLDIQPAWERFDNQGDAARGYVGCSVSLSFPGLPNPSSHLYVLFSGVNGQPLALLDGMRLSTWCTSALHGLATGYLSREDTSKLLIIGDDPRLPRLISAYANVRKLTTILMSGTGNDTRKRLAALPSLKGVHLDDIDRPEAAQEGADLICIADAPSDDTLDFLDPSAGCHVDVLDPKAKLPASLLYEARLFTSDLVGLPESELEWAADLSDLAQGKKAGRRYYGQRTLFLPSHRTGLPDHALAEHVFLRT